VQIYIEILKQLIINMLKFNKKKYNQILFTYWY